MKGLLTLYLLFAMITASAQGWSKFNTGDLRKFQNDISISSGYYFDSDAITDAFAIKFLNNDFINDESKDVVSSKLSDVNRLGAATINKISYTRYPDSLFGMRNCFFSVSLNNNYHINSEFSRDAFELLFRGNKAYAGKKALIDNFVFQDILYQQINFTFGHRFKRNENWFGYSGGFSFNKGQKHYMLETDRAILYTENMGQYIDLDVKGEFHRSDSSTDNIASMKGAGAAGDFTFYWQTKNKNILSFSAENFGFITWNSNSTFISTDTLFHFEGVDVSYLFDLTDTIRKTISLDSALVEPYLTERTKKSYTSPLPALLKLNYQYVLSKEKANLEAEAGYLLFATANPYESVKLNYSVNANNQFGIKLRYGGYGGFNAGLSYRLLFLKDWSFRIESDYLSSMLNQKNGCGHGAFVEISAYF